jgi:hypothetical protein
VSDPATRPQRAASFKPLVVSVDRATTWSEASAASARQWAVLCCAGTVGREQASEWSEERPRRNRKRAQCWRRGHIQFSPERRCAGWSGGELSVVRCGSRRRMPGMVCRERRGGRKRRAGRAVSSTPVKEWQGTFISRALGGLRKGEGAGLGHRETTSPELTALRAVNVPRPRKHRTE